MLAIPGLGGAALRRLLARHGSPSAVLRAGVAGAQGLLSAQQASHFAKGPQEPEALLQRTLRWLDESPQRGLLPLGDPRYPEALLNTPDPPLLLHWAGRLDLLKQRCVAVVGSRDASAQGNTHAAQFGQALSQAGFCVVSGLALGIDGAAHEGALQGPGSTIAVLGCGLDQNYPPAHRRLRERLAQDGLLLSEWLLGTPPRPAHFPQRNRIIAGLSEGCLVVEAALRSGSLITARLAAEYGREVFAIPGSIHEPLAKGCHELLKQGATLVQSPQDIFDELLPAQVRAGQTANKPPLKARTQSSPSPRPGADGTLAQTALSPALQQVLQVMDSQAVTFDVLQARCGIPTETLQSLLLDLELEGLVARLPGALLQRLYRA
ncbi:DNA-processing protein DprA [Roseateles sp. BYS180W]|uniref:DNA-processing protein DprA n=1 Tax=Roseateles rivi TaxID=3299028 RepID=A0ABW7FWI3_9BURK